MDTKNNEYPKNNDHGNRSAKSNEGVVKKGNSNDGFLGFLKNNIVAVLLILILLIVLIWNAVRISTIEAERTSLITQHESEKDSIQIKNLESSSKIFSWSVRSELMRNNTENLNQLVNEFVRESGADLVQLIDPETNMIILSSDKKFEGTEYSQTRDYALTEPQTLREDGGIKIITPVMGLNAALGILIVQMR